MIKDSLEITTQMACSDVALQEFCDYHPQDFLEKHSNVARGVRCKDVVYYFDLDEFNELLLVDFLWTGT